MPPLSNARSDPAEELRATALRLFVMTSYAGASLQQIADEAGYSKSSVLYHFSSKEALLESALAPAVSKLHALLTNTIGRIADDALRADFIDEFIDFLLEYRFEAHIIINQGQSLAGIETIDRARESIWHLGDAFLNELPSTKQRIRLGVALAGAAYVLATTAADKAGSNTEPIGEVRQALIDVMTELLLPLGTAAAADSGSSGPVPPASFTPAD
ncbi:MULTISPECIES: TetR/AcrR family transcriptional regulator [Subtercola]|nr:MULTISPECIES: TetR/AcrR family transcriptional regulator [Subtercola]MEA9986392.1 TetR/AcrR family transcriptional regulator [Subtercola sp. RTI3]